MSLFSALYTGVTGLQAYGDSLQVTGDNIANLETVGYKSSRAEFSDLLSQTIGGASGKGQVGRGVQLEKISSSFSQGSLTTTEELTDLAIDGDGFFVVIDPDTNTQYYTRDGQFTLNSEGQLVTSEGYYVMGYSYDDLGNVVLGELSELELSQSTVLPEETSAVEITTALDSDASVTTFDIDDAAATSEISTTIAVYDSLGAEHTLSVYLNKTGVNSWEWHACCDNAEVGITTDGLYEGASGTLTFTNGELSAMTTDVDNGWDFTGTTQTLSFSFGPVAGAGTGDVETTQTATDSSILSQTQDGYASGTLSSIDIDTSGVMSGTYTNGVTLSIGQLALANFVNLDGLNKMGSGLYTETPESGEATINRANTSGLGTIASYSLEQSNVDLASEFVDLIQTQSAYQGSTKIITVTNDLLSELTNLVR